MTARIVGIVRLVRVERVGRVAGEALGDLEIAARILGLDRGRTDDDLRAEGPQRRDL